VQNLQTVYELFSGHGQISTDFSYGGVHRISAGKAARAPTPGAPSASVGLILRLAPGSPPRCGRARLPFALIIKGTKPSRELFFNQVKIPNTLQEHMRFLRT